jgi:hypothetical protein
VFETVNTTAAILAGPAPAARLAGPTVRFTWLPGAEGSLYWLDVGTTPGGADVYAASQGTALSRTITNVPTTGGTLYVRLWSLLSGRWTYFDYRFTTANNANQALPLEPPQGAVLTRGDVMFRWTATASATQYWLDLGTTPGGNDIYAATQGLNTSVIVNGVAINGSRVHARLWTLQAGAWTWIDYSYLTADATRMATIWSPLENSVIRNGTAEFRWTPPPSSTNTWLDIGTAPGTSNLYSSAPGASQAAAVTGLPTGTPLYVRLWTLMSGRLDFLDYVFQTQD